MKGNINKEIKEVESETLEVDKIQDLERARGCEVENECRKRVSLKMSVVSYVM